MQFENTWPLAVCKSASVQRISAPVVDVTSPHNDAHGDDGTVRMAAPCPTNPAATIAVDGIKSRMAKISNGYLANSNEGMSSMGCSSSNERDWCFKSILTSKRWDQIPYLEHQET